MKKKEYILLAIVMIAIFLLGLFEMKSTQLSNSEKWNNEECWNILSNYTSQFPCDFEVATKEIEQRIYGVWQVKEFVGYDNSTQYQWDGYDGDIFIFDQKAWIDGGIPEYKPVYYCYTADISQLSTEAFLDVTWTDGSYEDKEGILTIAICSQKNEKFGSAVDVEALKFIICEDVLIMEKNGSYFKLERVGQVQMLEIFFD